MSLIVTCMVGVANDSFTYCPQPAGVTDAAGDTTNSSPGFCTLNCSRYISLIGAENVTTPSLPTPANARWALGGTVAHEAPGGPPPVKGPRPE